MTLSSLTNLEVEQGVIGTLLSDPSGLIVAGLAGQLKPEHFSELVHARIHEAISCLAAAGKSVSPMLVFAHMRDDPTLTELGGMAYLAGLVARAYAPAHVKTQAEFLRELADRRSIIAIADRLHGDASQISIHAPFRQTLAAAIDEMQQTFSDGSGRKTTFTAAEAADALIDMTKRIQNGGADRNAIPTGIGPLDAMTGGLHRGELGILAARPGVGKSLVAMEIARNVSGQGGGTVVFSLEMPVTLLMPRLISSTMWSAAGANNIPYTRILRGQLSAMETRWVADVANEIGRFPLIIDDAPGLSPAEVEARAQVAKARFERAGKSLDLVIVDHLHKMRHPGAVSKVAEFTEISSRLAEMAKRLNCPVLALAQLNRQVENRDDKRPQLADLRESGSIEQDADNVFFIYRPAYYIERKRCSDPGAEADRLADLAAVENKLEILIEKQRSGPVGAVELWCDVAHNVIIDPASPEFREVAA